jgi:hypothetical protein
MTEFEAEKAQEVFDEFVLKEKTSTVCGTKMVGRYFHFNGSTMSDQSEDKEGLTNILKLVFEKIGEYFKLNQKQINRINSEALKLAFGDHLFSSYLLDNQIKGISHEFGPSLVTMCFNVICDEDAEEMKRLQVITVLYLKIPQTEKYQYSDAIQIYDEDLNE